DEVLLYKKISGKVYEHKRLSALFDIISKNVTAAVISVKALMQVFPRRGKFSESILSLQKKSEYNLHSVVTNLINIGYKREERVINKGQFALRGDILDIFPINFENAFRLEFFGDTLENIRQIDIISYTSAFSQEKLQICPAKEFYFEDKEAIIEDLKKRVKNSKLDADSYTTLKNQIDEIVNSLENFEEDASLNYLLPYSCSKITDYLPLDTTIIFDEPRLLNDIKATLFKEFDSRFVTLLNCGMILDFHKNQCLPQDEVFEFLGFTKLSLSNFTVSNPIFKTPEVVSFNVSNAPKYLNNLDAFFNDVNAFIGSGHKIIFYCNTNDENLSFIKNISGIKEYDKDGHGALIYQNSNLENGYIDRENKLVVFGNLDIVKRRVKKLSHQNAVDVFSDFEIDDFVVHETHGVGIFRGMSVLRGALGQKEYLTVEFKDGDALHVPCDQMDILSKYSADKIPGLSKIGGKDFSNLKSRARKAIKELALNLKMMYLEREQRIGFKFNQDNEIQKDFEDSFEYEETADQLKCIKEIKSDMESNKVMDRLLCGDVGYGKTEVALRAALKAVLSNKQVAFLCPTTILSMQHYSVCLQRFSDFPVRFALLNRFCPAKNQKQILEDLAAGKIDVIIGTHRLLSEDVKYSDLGLLIIDEEQRFGVLHKDKIKLLKNNVEVLSMSATPIPRTLHMSLSGIRDISVIETPPKDRMAPQVYAMEYSDELIVDAINKEILRGGQTFVLYNRVETIDGFYTKLKRLVKHARIAVAHGQMGQERLEDALIKFYNNECDVLLCTTIIENGIDIKNANTLIVIDADKFGLSQLYQLKGRVGRSNILAYAFFTFSKDKVLTVDAYKRLQAIVEFNELSSGFKIAMKDLEIRGAGSVLGNMQSGHIEKIGYDMYIKILKEESDKLNGKNPALHVSIDVDINAYIPTAYIENENERIKLYKNLTKIESLEHAKETYNNLKDIYGFVPSEIKNLIAVACLRFLASKIGVCNITIKKSESFVKFENIESLNNEKIANTLKNNKRLTLTLLDRPKIIFNDNSKNKLDIIIDFLKAAGE
ncbi:MAG: transcription-repair coupling factor, partial [Firmicutes bacterium]|nr:transcription-repair coupling factor [Bacillota bacterium]